MLTREREIRESATIPRRRSSRRYIARRQGAGAVVCVIAARGLLVVCWWPDVIDAGRIQTISVTKMEKRPRNE